MDVTCPCGCDNGKTFHPVFGSERICSVCEGTGILTYERAKELDLDYLFKEKIEKERQDYMDNIRELAKPLVKWINENGNPYTNIVISYDSIKVFSQEIGVPILDYIGD